MPRLILWWLMGALLVQAGCSGRYVFTLPDQVAPVGGETAAVLRLQRQEVGAWYMPARDALVRFQAENGPLRAAFTDKRGYAAASVPVGDTTGVFFLHVAHTNLRGDEYEAYVPTYVWDPDSYVTAVDVDALPMRHNQAQQKAMATLAAGSYIVYFTDEDVADHAELHEDLARAGYPEGPIIQWSREDWRIVRDTSGKIPRLVLTNKVVSPLDFLKKQFPNLQAGVAGSRIGRRSFGGGGLKLVTLEQAAELYGNELTPTSGPTTTSAPTTASAPAATASATRPASLPATLPKS